MLLAALARAWRFPARVVVGTLLEVGDESVAAYGHAWTEIYDGNVWRRADAAQIWGPEDTAAAGSRLYYLPLGVLESEGPGYLLPLFNLMARTYPESIEVVWGDPRTPGTP